MPASVQARSLLLPLLPLVLSACVVAPPREYHRAPPPPPAPVVQAPPQAAPLYFYPERGQTEAQQDRDRYECYRWAVRETGFDPGMTALRQPQAQVVGGGPVRDGAPVVAGAATGAVLGAVISSPRHAGEAMVLGAIFGAAMGAAAQEQQAQAAERAQARREAAAEQAQQQAQRPMNNFRRAVSACMAGRGYRVG